MIKLILARFLERNLDDILALFTKLDQQLEAYIAREEAQVANLKDDKLRIELQISQRSSAVERAAATKAKIAPLTE